jgi:hypothetical protein
MIVPFWTTRIEGCYELQALSAPCFPFTLQPAHSSWLDSVPLGKKLSTNRMNPLPILTSYFFKKTGRLSSGLYSTFLQKYFPLASRPVSVEKMVTEIGGNVRIWGKSISTLQLNVPHHDRNVWVTDYDVGRSGPSSDFMFSWPCYVYFIINGRGKLYLAFYALGMMESSCLSVH